VADPKLTIVGDSAKAEAAIVAMEKKVDRLEEKLKRTGRAARSAGNQTKQSFGASAINSIGQYAAQFVSVTAAIGTATAAMQHHDKVRAESAQKQRAASAGLAELSQLAVQTANPEQTLQRLRDEARAAFGKGLGSSVSDAAGVIFSLDSAGITEAADRELFIDLAANKVVGDSAGFAQAAAALQTAIGKQIAGSYRDIVSKAFAASAASPSRADELLTAAAQSGAAGTASRLGMNDAEVLAATALAARASGGASTGGTQVSSLLAALEKRGGFEGLSLSDAISQVQGMGLQGEELMSFLGRKEAVAGFSTLSKNLEEYNRVLESINAAPRSDVAGRAINLPSTVAEIEAALSAEEQTAKLENARVSLGTTRNFREAAEAAVVRQIEQEYGTVASFFANTTGQLARFNPLRSDEGYLRDQDVQSYVQQADPQLFEKIARHLESLDRKTSVRQPMRTEP
jgi:hypothetical protein